MQACTAGYVLTNVTTPESSQSLLPWLYILGSDHIEKAALTLLSGLAVTK
jgi:hypothetical protein